MVPSWLKMVFNVNFCKFIQILIKLKKYEPVLLKVLFYKISSFHPPSTCPFLLVLSLILDFFLFMLNGKIMSIF